MQRFSRPTVSPNKPNFVQNNNPALEKSLDYATCPNKCWSLRAASGQVKPPTEPSRSRLGFAQAQLGPTSHVTVILFSLQGAMARIGPTVLAAQIGVTWVIFSWIFFQIHALAADESLPGRCPACLAPTSQHHLHSKRCACVHAAFVASAGMRPFTSYVDNPRVPIPGVLVLGNVHCVQWGLI